MNDRSSKGLAPAEQTSADVDAATRRLMAALDALESAVERRRDADRDEDELARRIQALGTDRSRLADELDTALVKSRRLERSNREIAERLDTAIGTIRAVLDGKDDGGEHAQGLVEQSGEEHQEESGIVPKAALTAALTAPNAAPKPALEPAPETAPETALETAPVEEHEGEAEDILHGGALSEEGDEEEEDEDAEDEEGEEEGEDEEEDEEK
jgi:hypothetical protein